MAEYTNRKLLADLKPNKILLGIEDRSAIDEVVNVEAEEPTSRKEQGSRAVYLSRSFGDYRAAPRSPKITDFGSAIKGDTSKLYYHGIQPRIFRAPEVILEAGWTYSADIWSLGVMVSFLLEIAMLSGSLN